MRPPTFIGGNLETVETVETTTETASMRPPTFIGGNQRYDDDSENDGIFTLQ